MGTVMLALKHRTGGEVLGLAELSLQPCDGKVPGDLRLPSLPWTSDNEQVAYMSNLAVKTAWRRKGLGGSLVAACEQVARSWGFDHLYLHAALKEEGLLGMYKDMDYEALPEFDQPEWVQKLAGREKVRYHRKALAAPASSAAST